MENRETLKTWSYACSFVSPQESTTNSVAKDGNSHDKETFRVLTDFMQHREKIV